MFKFFTPTAISCKRRFVTPLANCITVLVAMFLLTSAANAQYCNFYYVQSGASGTGTPSSPASLTTALGQTTNGGTIIMEAGTYSLTSTLAIPAGVVIDGGYTIAGSGQWIKSTAAATMLNIVPAMQTATVNGNAIGFYIGVLPSANDELKDLTINVVPNGASGTYNNSGLSIYGVYFNNVSGTLLSRCIVTTGKASAGAVGGTPSGSGGGSGGGQGGAGSTQTGGYGGGCGSGGVPGSAPTTHTWGSDAGGQGGAGCCSSPENTVGCGSNGCQANNGANGLTGGSANPQTGQPTNTPGSSDQYYAPVAGLQGFSGDGGGGGGGGGAGAYGNCCGTVGINCGSETLSGGNGGNGGSGGLGGNGGYGGGGSFAVWAYGSAKDVLLDCSLNAGAGGTGGAGGNGQPGAGGQGGGAGLQNGGTRGGGGGNGGTGGTGGAGGTGQQGANGASYTLFNSSGASVVTSGATSVPNDGTVTANWISGCSNSEITITKTTTDQWSNFIGTDALFENNLTATSSTYNFSSGTAVIYYPNNSADGDKNITLGSTTLSNFIVLKGDNRSVSPITTPINAIGSPCIFDNINLTNSLTSGQAANVTAYEWQISLVSNPTAVVYTSTAANPGVVTPPVTGWISGGVYQVRFRVQEQCCGWSIPMWSGFTVGNAVTPSVTISASSASICAGTSVTFTATPVQGGPSPGYQWLKNGNNVGTNSPTYTDNALNNSDAINVVMTSSSTCAYPPTATTTPILVTVTAYPSATITSSGPTTFCQGGSVTLSVSSNAYNYQWNNGATTQSVLVTDEGGYIVTVSAPGSNCSIVDAAVVTVNPLPTASITASGPTTFCTGGSVTLTAGAASSYSWSSGQTTQSITVTSGSNYAVTVSSCGSCSAASSATIVTVNPLPAATITANGPTTFCAGGSVTLTASAGATWLWTDGETTQSITATTGGSYSVAVTSAAGCTATSGTTIVTVNPLPTATITASGPTTFCSGGSVTLTASAGTSWLWTGGATTQSITVTSGGNYSVAVTNAAGCTATSAVTVVTISSNPTPTITTNGPTTFCAGGSVTLTASQGVSYLWSNGLTTQGITVTSGGSYSVNVTVSGGCSGTSAPTVVTVNPLPAATITPSGPTTFCQGGNVTLTASAGTSWLWTGGATTQSITATSGGNYSVAVTNAAGCTATSAITVVTVNPLPTATITPSGPTTFCSGGSVTLTASAGASWLWTGGATTQSITVTSGGSYSVAVTNAAGCTATSATIVVTVNPLPTATITASGPTTFCAGGSVTLTASAGTSWSWTGGATTQSITVTSGGNYSVAVTNASGCTATSAATVVTVNPLPTATITASGPTTFCTGGSVTLTASAGASWLWTGGATTQSITVTTGGNYSVAVTNAAGCTATSAVTVVTISSNPTPVITANGPTKFCSGGSVTLTASQGVSYLWSNGLTTQGITVTSGGSYSVNVTVSGGCSGTSAPTVVTVNPLPTATITASGPTTFCSGGSVTLTASTGASWLWTGGGTTQSITVTSGGNYSVAVTNSAGCSATSAATAVTVNPLPTATITASGPTTFCSGGSVTLTASAGTSWLWTGGATTQSITVTSGGNYSVAVTNAAGCTATSAVTVVTISSNPTPTITTNGPTTFCAGGSVTLTASQGVSYLWSNGFTTQGITVTSGGSYSVNVTVSGGCSGTSAPTVVTVNPLPAATITPSGPTTFCQGGNVTLTASAGTSWLWTGGATTQSITATSGGNYSVAVTNAAGCTATSAITVVTVNPLPTATITPSGPTTFCSGGSVTLTASAGTSWLWTGGATTQSITVTSGGSYSVTVKNAVGCTATSAATIVTINSNPTPTITASGPTTFCSGGSVTLTASQGINYSWSNGSTTSSITVTANGTFTVNVTVSGGCSGTSTPTMVTVNPLPTATITASGPTTFCQGGNVTLTASAGSSWLWSNGATTQSITATSANSYTVAVTNAAGCKATSAATVVTVNPLPTATITASGPTTFCQGGNVTLTASAGASWLWTGGATTQSITVTSGGSYSVAVTNASGCKATSSATVVTVNPLPTATITANGPTTFCSGGSVTLTASAGASWLWTGGATTQSITVTTGGSYSVTVTNASGCKATSAATVVTVTSNVVPTITASGPTTFCQGGSVTLTSSAGVSYHWSSGQTVQSITVTSGGSYSVNVTVSGGCSGTSAPTVVTVNPLPTATITASGPTTFCSGGSVTLTASAGTSWLWTGGATTQSITVTAGGSYSVVVTNASGCKATSAATVVTVTSNVVPTITASGPTTFCQGGSVTLTSSAGATYHWSSGQTTQSITVSAAGSYTVNVTVSGGCSGTSAPKVVTVNPLPVATITAGGPTTFCPGGSVTLTSSPGSSYLWTGGAITQSIHATVSGSYVVIVRNAAGCSATSAPVIVTVLSSPTAKIKADGPVKFCEGGHVTLSANAGNNLKYKWSSGQTTRSITVSSSGTFTVTVTNVGGCSKTSTSVVVTVNPLPTATITANGPTTFCSGGNVKLSADAGTGFKYKWSTGATTRAITVFSSGSYVVTVTNSTKCSEASDPARVVVHNCPGPVDGKMDDNTGVQSSISAPNDNGDLLVSVYPNPYSGEFHVKLVSGSNANIDVKVFDLNGKLLEERRNIAYGTDVVLGNNYATGVYIVQVKQGETSRQMRVIKMD